MISLQQATEELNNAIAAVNVALVRKYTVGAELCLSDCVLGFGKVDQNWCLYIVSNNNVRVRLETMSRRVRIEACMRLDDLGALLNDQVLQQTRELEDAVKSALGFAARVGAL